MADTPLISAGHPATPLRLESAAPHSRAHLSPLDWGLIATHLLLTVAVGVALSASAPASPPTSNDVDEVSENGATEVCTKGKQPKGGVEGGKGGAEYFLAGRRSSGLAVALSLVSGLMSGISYLGGPGFSYVNGAGVLVGYTVAGCLSPPIAAHIILPIYRDLELTTAYEYLERRFCTALRTAAACIFVLKTLLYLAVVLYAPALTLSTLTTIPASGCILATGGVAGAYTVKGGMRAVIWTDAIQSVMMIAVAVAALATAVHRSGGFGQVVSTLHHNGMLLDPSYFFGWHPLPHPPPAERNWTSPDAGVERAEVETNDFWTLAIGVTLTSCAQGFADQLAAQRWLSVKDTAAMQRGVYQTGALQVLMNILMFGIGLVIYAFYAERRESPVRDALSGDSDKIFPYFVLTELPSGIPGLLVAAVLGSTMSVFSGGINAAATSIYVDVLRNACGWRLTDFRMLKFVQAMTVVLSLLVIGLAFAASAVGGLVKASVSLMGLTLGPLLGVTLLGMLSRRSNWQGACGGLAVGLCGTGWLTASSAVCPPAHKLTTCSPATAVGHVSFFWYGGLLAVVALCVGWLLSQFFPPPPQSKLEGLVVWGLGGRADRSSRGQDATVHTPLLPTGETTNPSVQ